jgi:hypothetical protein
MNESQTLQVDPHCVLGKRLVYIQARSLRAKKLYGAVDPGTSCKEKRKGYIVKNKNIRGKS